jgi:CyaY protein
MMLVRFLMAQIIPFASKRREQTLLLNCAHFPRRGLVMTESEFNELVDETFDALELGLDRVEQELDYAAAQQLWLAARAGGFHFCWDEAAGDWRDTRSGELFRPFVIEQMRTQAAVEFDWERGE